MNVTPILFFVVVAIVLWLASKSMDRSRIEAYVTERGGRIDRITRSPFGRGWFGERGDRIYEVVYVDRAGERRWATCKTSMLSGVYWTGDRQALADDVAFDRLTADGEAGNPVRRRFPMRRGGSPSVPTSNLSADGDHAMPDPAAIEDEIAVLRRRLAELERLRRQSGA